MRGSWRVETRCERPLVPLVAGMGLKKDQCVWSKVEVASGRSTAALVANFERRRVRHRLDESTPLYKGHALRSRVGGGDSTLA